MKTPKLEHKTTFHKCLLCCAFTLFITVFPSCQKSFLDKKPDKALVVPATLGDFQALLDNSTNVINLAPFLNELSTDDFYTTDAGLLNIGSYAPYERNTYLFAEKLYEGSTVQDWDVPYQQVLYANVVLDGLQKLTTDPSTLSQYNAIKGTALFTRAFAFYNLAQEFSKPYVAATANTDLGIPLRLTANVTDRSVRSTLQATYDQIIGDLTQAQALLPKQAAIKTRPTSIAVMALLARIYLSMGMYDKAEGYADQSLKLNSKLIDYNTLNASASRPLPLALPNGNDEVLYYTSVISSFYGTSTLRSVDSTLFSSYDNNDLRKVIFFRDRGNGIHTFKGTYSGTSPIFGGLAVDEMYLIRAECYARNGKTSNAMDDLNTLLKLRWATGTFISLAAGNSNDALSIILKERRKELVGRCLRWGDLRRLNQDQRFSISIIHLNGGHSFTLSPNSNKYVFPIPDDEIASSGIQQNPR